MGYRFGELHSLAVLDLPWTGASHSECAVVQHPARTGVLSRCAECNSYAAAWCHADTAAWCHANATGASGLPLLSLRAVGTDSVRYRVVLSHDDSGYHVRQSQHHQSELDLRRIDSVYSVVR